MKIGKGTPLDVVMRWDAENVQSVGRLAYRDRATYLEYDMDFLKSSLEISPVFHKAREGLERPYRTDVFEGLHGVFNDSLPDGWGRLLLDRRARQLGIEPKSLTPLDRLACVGSAGIGALCYAPSVNAWDPGENSVDLDRLAEGSRMVLEGDASEVLSVLGRVGGSPAGARPKALISLGRDGRAVHGTDRIPLGYDHYLAKFRGHGDPRDVAIIEKIYASMAEDSGIAIPETRLIESRDDGFYFAVRRFDRLGDRRIHVHSASGMLYSDIRFPALDYRDLILLTRLVTRDQRECKAMFTLAVFNVLAHNRDDHARQFSFKMTRDGVWTLAPAYDLTWSTGPGGQHSTSVLGHGKDITRKTLMELGENADLGEKESSQVIERVEDAVSKWPVLAREYGASSDTARAVERALNSVRV